MYVSFTRQKTGLCLWYAPQGLISNRCSIIFFFGQMVSIQISLDELISIFLTRIMWDGYYYCPYYTDEEIKTQEGDRPSISTPDTLSCLQATETWDTEGESGSWREGSEGEPWFLQLCSVDSDYREGQVREINVSCGMLRGSSELGPIGHGFQHAITFRIPFLFRIHSFLLVALFHPTAYSRAQCGRNYISSLLICSPQPTFIVMHILYMRFCVPDLETQPWVDSQPVNLVWAALVCQTLYRYVTTSILQSTISQMRNADFQVESGVGGWQAPITQQEVDTSPQPGPLDSKPPTFSMTFWNVTGPLSISSYCPGPHEVQCRGPDPEYPPHGQSECLRADGSRDGGLVNRQHEPPASARKQVSPGTPPLALGLYKAESEGRAEGSRGWRGKVGILQGGDKGPNMKGCLGEAA